MIIHNYISSFNDHFPELAALSPWNITRDITSIIRNQMNMLSKDYQIKDEIAIHPSAMIETNVTLKGPIIISENCFVGANAYLRGGVFLAPSVSIGPGCEIKSCIILNNTAMAHFNFAGDSIIGAYVNFEAGSVIANYHNDRDDKTIFISENGQIVGTDVQKFGALIGDNTKIGANAVLSPGTILPVKSVVARLALIQQT